MEQPGLYFRNNVGGGIHLVEAMVAAGVKRIVFSSTCATYGEPERMPITESSPQRPTNPYGESKLMLEKILLWQQELSGLEPVFLRYFNACGALARLGEDHDPESHLIPVILQVALGRRERVTIFGDDYDTPDGTCIRDYVHVGDLAHAHALAIVGNATGAFNLGTGDGHSVQEIVRVARETTGHAIPADVVARRPGDPARLVADGSKAREFLGWEPRMSDIREIVASAWDWHRAHPDGYPD